MRDAPDEKELVVPLASEELRLEKRETSTGKVRVQTVVETVDELARATVEEESLDVQRVPVGKVVAEPPGIRTEGDVTIIPVLERNDDRGETLGARRRGSHPPHYKLSAGGDAGNLAKTKGCN